MRLKFRSKFNYGYLHSVISKTLYNFKVKKAQGARDNQFLFENVQSNEIFEIFKIFKYIRWINLTTQKQTFVVLRLLVLLVSILHSLGNGFVCYFRSLKFTLGKNRLDIIYVSDSIQQERLSNEFEVGKIYFWSLSQSM